MGRAELSVPWRTVCRVRVHVVQVAYGDGEPVAERVARVAALVREQRGADLVVLPELWAPTGMDYRRWEAAAEPVDGPTITAVSAAAAEIGAFVHAGSIIERSAAPGPEGRFLWNTSVVLGPDGATVAVYRKIHRFGFTAGEPALIEAGADLVTLDALETRIGLATCYDLRFPEQFRLLLDRGAELFVVPAAWPAARVGHWNLLGRARAIEDQCFVVQCNTGGSHAGIEMGGRSQVVAPTGEVLAEAGAGEEVLVVDLDVSQVAEYRKTFPVLEDRRL